MQPPLNSENQLLLACANCKRKANSEADNCTFKQCSGCHLVRYCNRECQLAHRKIHKAYCKPVNTNNNNSTQTIINNILRYCENGNLDGLKKEIARGTDLRAASKDQIFEAFCHLIFGHFYGCAEFLLQQNADPNAQDKDGLSPLFTA